MRRLVVAATLLAPLTACVSLPEAGPVATRPEASGTPQAGGFDYRPPSPQPGDGADSIVRGFLDSLRQTPLTYAVARTYLTEAASASWAPSQRTIVYDDGSLSRQVVGNRATVSLGSAVELDGRGSWLGDLSEGQGLSFDLHLVQEAGEWRISDPPDALIVARTFFESRFARYDLHFFDPSGQVLVPEPVYLPVGDTTPYLLVSGLLAGPRESLQAVERTYFPPGTRLELARPVTDGVIDIPLSDEILDTDTGQLDLALAQLAWTLRQLPGIDEMRVTVGGAPVDRATGASTRSVHGWSSYDPAGGGVDDQLYALEGNDLVLQDGGDVVGVGTPFGRTPMRSLAVSQGLSGETTVTGVAADGSLVLTGEPDGASRPRERYAGSNVLRPAYDRFDNVWVLDRTVGGARLLTGGAQGRLRPIRVFGVSGRDVTAFELSRDGTRLAAVVDGHAVMARISRSETGHPTSALPAVPVQFGEPAPAGRAVDLAWTSPDTVGVLVRPGSNISQVIIAGVDGSDSLDVDATELAPIFERAVDVITWPGADAPVLLRTRSGAFYQVSSTGQWALSDLPPDLVGPTFPG